MRRLEDAIRITRTQVRRAQIWDRTSQGLLWGWLAAGVVVLAGKLTLPDVAMAGAVAAMAWVAVMAAIAALTSRRISPVSAAVLLDRAGRLQGWPLVALDHPGHEWLANAPGSAGVEAGLPRLRPWHFVRRMLPGAGFLALALLLPQQINLAEVISPRPNTAADRALQRLEEKMEALAAKDALPQEELQKLREELEALHQKAESGSFSQEGWEGLDHLSEQMHEMAREKAARLNQAATAAQSMSKALAGELAQAEAREKLEALERAMSALGETPLPEALREKLRQAMQGGNPESMDPRQLQDALDDLQQFLDREMESLAQQAERDHNHGEGG